MKVVMILVSVSFIGCASYLPKDQAKFTFKEKSSLDFQNLEKKVTGLVYHDREKVVYSDSKAQEMSVRLVRNCMPGSLGNVSIVYDVNLKKDGDTLNMNFSPVGGRTDYIRLSAYDSTAKEFDYSDNILCSKEQAQDAAEKIKREIAGN